MTLEEKIGQMLVVGFPAGREGLEHLERAVGEFAAGNFILFSRNIGSPREVFELTSRIRALVARRVALPPFISVDQEGGTVARLREGVLPLPGAMLQAAAVEGGAKTREDIRTLAYLCGRELWALGINWDLAPVADVNVNPANPVISVRSYGDKPEVVADFASAFAQGLADAGILASAKHFPGHGDTAVDSHLGLPLIEHSLERLHRLELIPFKRLIAEGIASVMTAHVRFPALEPGGLPATLSSKVIQGFLRGSLGFKGIVTTDCMEMKAIADNFPDAAVMAVEAGADIIDVSHTFELQKAAAQAIARAVREGRIPESRIDESLDRIAAFKAALPPPPSTWEAVAPSLASPSELGFARSFFREGLASFSETPAVAPAAKSLYVDVLPVNLTGAEDSSGGRPQRVWELLAGSGLDALAVSIEPTEAEIAKALELAEGRDVVLGVFNAASHEGQLSLATELATRCRSSGTRLSFVSMRSPYDLAPLRKAVGADAQAPSFVCAFEYTEESAKAVVGFLTGTVAVRGGAPVSLLHI